MVVQETDGLPLPLGVNAVRRDLGPERMAQLSRILKASIVYGLEHREEALQYAMQFARGLATTTADSSSACTSTTGRWIWASADRRASDSFWGAPPSVATSRKASRSTSSSSEIRMRRNQ